MALDAVTEIVEIDTAAEVQLPGEVGGVPSLQELVCGWLARHLHALEEIDALPPHLAETVRNAIQRDRSLIACEGDLAVWLAAVSASGDATRLSLRWAAGLGDSALLLLARRPEWSRSLVSLDLGFCEEVTDVGVSSIAEGVLGLEVLVLAGCRRCGDRSAAAIGRHLRRLRCLNLAAWRAAQSRPVHVRSHLLSAWIGAPKVSDGRWRAGGRARLWRAA